MKLGAVTLIVALLAGCGKSDDELRQMMRDEIAKANARSYITSAQVIGPYSPAVQAGNLVFVSGQIGINDASELVGDDVESQTKQALKNMTALLRRMGCDSSDVVSCMVFLKDIKDFARMNQIYGGFFLEGRYPTRSTVEVANLPKNAKVEIACIAVKSK